MHIDRDRFISDLEKLAAFTDGTPPGISRLAFAEADQQARVWLKSQCRDAGLSVREDEEATCSPAGPAPSPSLLP